MNDRSVISVVGLGYVGLPVAVGFARRGYQVVAFDVDNTRVEELRKGHDRTREVDLGGRLPDTLNITNKAADLEWANVYIVTVPTPIDVENRPDLTLLLEASGTIGRALKQGDIVVYESTVYPGTTEELCVPVLEAESGLSLGSGFGVGYSPERINPGDKEHRFDTIKKVISASDHATLDRLAQLYGSVVDAGVYRAPTIKTAEAAKVIENTQRDINIAFMNELAVIFERLDIDTGDVLSAAGTKWNFLPFTPGLVGGHCIGVDPYYLTYRARQASLDPKVILAGREINDSMGAWVADRLADQLKNRFGGFQGRSVAVLGVTFKADIPDVRNSKVMHLIGRLSALGLRVRAADPFADALLVREMYGIDLLPIDDLSGSDAVILAVGHADYRNQGWDLVNRLLAGGEGVVGDLHGILDRETTPKTVTLWRL